MRMDHWSDEDLAIKAQSGNEDAKNALVTRYYKICQFEARDSKQKLYDDDSKTGECMMALAKAIDTFATGKGATFNSYAKTLMRNALKDMVRKEDRRPSEVSISLESDGSELTMEDMFVSDSQTDVEAQAEIAKQALKDSIWEQLEDASDGDGELDKTIIRAVRTFAAELALCGRIKASPQAAKRLFEKTNSSVLFIVADNHEGMMLPEEEMVWRDGLCDILADALIHLVILKSEGYSIEESAESTGLSQALISRLMQSVRVFALGKAVADTVPQEKRKAASNWKPKLVVNENQGELFDAA